MTYEMWCGVLFAVELEARRAAQCNVYVCVQLGYAKALQNLLASCDVC